MTECEHTLNKRNVCTKCGDAVWKSYKKQQDMYEESKIMGNKEKQEEIEAQKEYEELLKEMSKDAEDDEKYDMKTLVIIFVVLILLIFASLYLMK